MAFKDIVGHERVKKILRKALQKKKIPNSMLFSGPEGVGKEETALVLAKAMNCERKKDDACETCASCRGINAGNFPDVMMIRPEGNVIKIEQMRTLRKIAYLKPMVGKRRVFILVKAEKMTEPAANSLLKILEEPPLFSYVILVAHNPFLIMPTIKSRCQILNFPPVSRGDIEKELMEKGYEEEKARVISRIVHGNLKQAMSLDWEDVQAKREQAWRMFVSLIKRENFALFLRNYAFSHKALIKEEWEQILEILSSFCRDSILFKEKGDVRLLLNPDYQEKIRKTEELVSLDWLMKCLQQIDYAIYGLGKNLNVNLLVSSFFANFKEWDYA
ncbi:MAG: DNA polymerase III subunit delta' [Candidatus Aminicenantes bacterium]|nr:MAG: DNA polymerase III subunit delta' [Candidatus Aminicenantes bacterium]